MNIKLPKDDTASKCSHLIKLTQRPPQQQPGHFHSNLKKLKEISKWKWFESWRHLLGRRFYWFLGRDGSRRQVSLASTIFEPAETSGTLQLEQLWVRSHVAKEETSAADVQDIGARRRRTKGPMTCISFWLCPETHILAVHGGTKSRSRSLRWMAN